MKTSPHGAPTTGSTDYIMAIVRQCEVKVQPLLIAHEHEVRAYPVDAARTAAATREVLRTRRLGAADAVHLWTRLLLSDEPLSVGLVGAGAAAAYTRPGSNPADRVVRDLCLLVPGIANLPGEVGPSSDDEDAVLEPARKRWGTEAVACMLADVEPLRANLTHERVDAVVRMLDGPLSVDALCVCAMAYRALGDATRMTTTGQRAMRAAYGHRLAGLIYAMGVIYLEEHHTPASATDLQGIR